MAERNRTTETVLYFAYGSNLPSRRLRSRAPSAVRVKTGHLPGHELRFHKTGADGSAKANAWYSGNPAHRVHGAIYRITAADLAVLDRYEEAGTGYDRINVSIDTDAGPLTAAAYFARRQAIVTAWQPFSWYKDYLLEGIEEHGFPHVYRDAIAAVATQADPDPERAADPCL